jgi:hypothetical protein
VLLKENIFAKLTSQLANNQFRIRGAERKPLGITMIQGDEEELI